MTDFKQLHDDMRQQNQSIKDLTSELSKLNVILTEVISDNKHRDTRISDCESNLSDVKDSIKKIHTQRTEDREEYKPTWDRSKQEQGKKDGWIYNLIWFAIVAILLIITNSVSSGAIKEWFSSPQQQKVDKK